MSAFLAFYGYAALLHIIWFARNNPPKTPVEYTVVAGYALFWPIAMLITIIMAARKP